MSFQACAEQRVEYDGALASLCNFTPPGDVKQEIARARNGGARLAEGVVKGKVVAVVTAGLIGAGVVFS